MRFPAPCRHLRVALHCFCSLNTLVSKPLQDRMQGAPPVVLICSEACALAEASSWFVSR